jgi:hypothetical protein
LLRLGTLMKGLGWAKYRAESPRIQCSFCTGNHFNMRMNLYPGWTASDTPTRDNQRRQGEKPRAFALELRITMMTERSPRRSTIPVVSPMDGIVRKLGTLLPCGGNPYAKFNIISCKIETAKWLPWHCPRTPHERTVRGRWQVCPLCSAHPHPSHHAYSSHSGRSGFIFFFEFPESLKKGV